MWTQNDSQKRIRCLEVRKIVVLFPAGERNFSLLISTYTGWVTQPHYSTDSRGYFPADVKAGGT